MELELDAVIVVRSNALTHPAVLDRVAGEVKAIDRVELQIVSLDRVQANVVILGDR